MTFSLGKFFPRTPINEPSLELSDSKWKELEGGYKGEIYDASAALKQLEQAETLEATNLVYQELWNELHHQGDVGLASYYAVPHLVRIAKQTQLVDHNVLSLVTVIELQRPKNNPKLPKALSAEYYAAIRDLEELAKISMKQDWDLGSAISALSAIALAKNQVKLANLILNLDNEEEIDELLKNY